MCESGSAGEGIVGVLSVVAIAILCVGAAMDVEALLFEGHTTTPIFAGLVANRDNHLAVGIIDVTDCVSTTTRAGIIHTGATQIAVDFIGIERNDCSLAEKIESSWPLQALPCASRLFFKKAGTAIDTIRPIIARTIMISTSVKPRFLFIKFDIFLSSCFQFLVFHRSYRSAEPFCFFIPDSVSLRLQVFFRDIPR